MFYDAVNLSKYIITKSVRDGFPINHLHLQKILWLVQKDFILRKKVAFVDPIEAWGFGPCVPNVYYNFFYHGAEKIVEEYDSQIIKPIDRKEIDYIVERTNYLMPWDLVKYTNVKGGAWDLTYKDGKGDKQMITFELIKELGVKA